MKTYQDIGILVMSAIIVAVIWAPVTYAQAVKDDGYVDASWFSSRQLAYLKFATSTFSKTSPLQALAFLERAHREKNYDLPKGTYGQKDWAGTFSKIAQLEDASDFDVIVLLNLKLRFDEHHALPPSLWQQVDTAILNFKFWHDQPTPKGLVDNMWYWSENHQLLFHTLEYLSGQLFPKQLFRTTRKRGRFHKEQGKQKILAWIDLKARYGFSEWHSNVYMVQNCVALLTLIDFADDNTVVKKATMLLDLILLDLAVHHHQGAFVASHSRTYKRDMTTATMEKTFHMLKLIFDQTANPYWKTNDMGAIFFSLSSRYQIPLIIKLIAEWRLPFVDRQRQGLPLDEHESIHDRPSGPLGIEYENEKDLTHILWPMGALSTWQTIAPTARVLERYHLWESKHFIGLKFLRGLGEQGEFLLQFLAHQYADAFSVGLLSQANSYLFRHPKYALSSVQAYRNGARSRQTQPWEAVINERALVFTSHPAVEAQSTENWDADVSPGFWTGNASLPFIAQYQNVAIIVYSPGYQEVPLEGLKRLTSYMPYTHAFFPQDAFDMIVNKNGWTFGKVNDVYIALYSERPVTWIPVGANGSAKGQMQKPFELRARGGAHNVWLVEMGSALEWDSFEQFVDEISARSIEVERSGSQGSNFGYHRFISFYYNSPSQGRMRLNASGQFKVRGEEISLNQFPRFENPWSKAAYGSLVYRIQDPVREIGLSLDFRSLGTRHAYGKD